MDRADYETAAEFKRRLSARIAVLDMRVYGSRARGDAETASDMDVFVEVEIVSPAVKEIVAETAWEIGFEKLIHISPLVFSKEELELSPVGSSPVVRNIFREGVKL